MKIDRIFPIIGLDWKINEKWQLNLVYPLNISVVYQINECWSAALAGRLFNLRYRFGSHECIEYHKHHFKKGLFQYRNNGAELAINYEKKNYSFNAHAGMTFGGQFILSNKHNKHKSHFDIDPAGYVGGEAVVKF